MNQMEIFRNPEFGSIRILEENGEYLFCGTDVATALGYTNPHKAVRDHTKGGNETFTPNQRRKSSHNLSSRGRCVPAHCPQQTSLCGAV